MLDTLYTAALWYLGIGFTLAAVGDTVQMLRRRPADERFLLGDTVAVTLVWPVVLYVAYLEAKKATGNG